MKALQNLLKNYQELFAFIFGIVVVVAGFSAYDNFLEKDATYYNDTIHVHADFLAYINNERLDLTDEQYQSSTEQILHRNFHFHDNKDNIIHRHAADLTLAEFLASLGFTLTNTCLSTDAAESYCTDNESALQLFVNGEVIGDITAYVPQDEDRILLYYGAPEAIELDAYLAQITDESCIYSGTCSERGTPPPESCGLTCEI